MKFAIDLLFLHGHIADAQLASELAAPSSPRASAQARPSQHPESTMKTTSTNLFKSLWYLGGLESLDPRIDDTDAAFGASYGNRIASERAFGKRNPQDERHAAAAAASLERCAAGGCA